MDRRPLVAGGATVAIVVLLVVASSAGPARLWTTVGTDGTAPGGAPTATVDRPPDDVTDDRDASTTGTLGWLQVASTTIAAVIVIAGIASVRRTGWTDRLRRVGARRRWHGTPLPEIDDGRVMIDVEKARAALRTGPPRNAIVACWQHLERDAAEAGLERWASETPSEYVERVIVSTSADATPIQTLAALYREARFSSHPLDDRHRAQAVDALEQVLVAVGADTGVR